MSETRRITSGNVTLGGATPGVYYYDSGQSKEFLTALPAAEVGNSAEIQLSGVYFQVAYAIDDATDSELGATINGNTVTLNPTAAGSYELVLTATAVNNQTFDLTIPVEVTGGPPLSTPAATATAAAATLTPVANTDNLITLTVKDSLGNTDTSFTGNHNVTVSGVAASVTGLYYGLFDGTIIEAGGTLTKSLVFTNGVATPNLNLPRALEQSISFSIEGVSSPATNTLTITPVLGPPAVMRLTQNITAPTVNGGQFAQQPILRFTDSASNLCTNDNSTQVTASKYHSGDWMLTGTTTATALNGIVTFNDLGATNTVRVTNAQVKFTPNASTNIYISAAVTLPAPSSGSSGGGGGGGGGTTPASSTINAAVTGDTVDINIPVNVNTGTGTGTVNVDTSFAENIFDGNTVINVPPVSWVDVYTLQMPASMLSGSEGEEGLTFATENGSIIVPGNMLLGLGTQGQVGITIGQGDKSLLPEEVREALGNRPLVQLSLTVDGQQQNWNNPGAPVIVSIPYTPTAAELADPEHIFVWYIDGSGNVQSVPNGRFDPATGRVTFTTTHFSYFGVAYVQQIFSDLTGVGWAKREIEVLASKGIVKGVSETEYAPFATITRADFLYPQGLSRFTKQFPSNIVRNVEKHFCTDGALLKPKVFLTEPMLAVDYSIIIPSNTPPDSYINGKLRSFSSGKIIVFNPCDTVVNTAAPPTKQYYTLFIRPQLIKKIAEEMGCPGEVRFLKLENPFSLDLLQAIRTFDKDSTETNRVYTARSDQGIAVTISYEIDGKLLSVVASEELQ